jgi:3'(2'), 5'-bisphosphate nucleotidase
MNNLVLTAIRASLKAGKEILKVYNSEFEVETKSDNSPLTLADKNAHKVIVDLLKKLPYPILSEEGKHANYIERKKWNKLWIVDPLDGTKEFVKRNGEFTVNIALVEDNKPILGVIYIPVEEILYFASTRIGAYKIRISVSEKIEMLEDLISVSDKLPIYSNRSIFTIVSSRSHLNTETINYIDRLKNKHGKIEVIAKGSSLKFCSIAEGTADEYPRFYPTIEWDTAAGHAILNATGYGIFNIDSNNEIYYNKENLLNPSFIVRKKS